MNRYVIGALALVGLTILLILILAGGHRRVPAPQVKSLPSYAYTNSEVSVVVAGPIVAPQNHNEARIVISKNSSVFTLYQGYDGDVIDSKIFNNTQNSYSNFLYALYYAGFGKSINTTIPNNKGLCSTGNRYDFYLKNNGQTVGHAWATDCTATPNSFGGNLGRTMSLFEAQIPQINTYTQNANL